MDKKIILASGSPRRRELIAMLQRSFEVIPAQGEEKSEKSSPREYVEELSRQKAVEVFGRISDSERVSSVVLGADTVVVNENKILGKPRDREDADEMISKMAGKSHEVLTGVTLIWLDEEQQMQVYSFVEKTKVHVCPMSEEEIQRYLDTPEPYDKAGAYGIQGQFGIFISGIEGDYQNVVGLPVSKLYRVLKARNL